MTEFTDERIIREAAQRYRDGLALDHLHARVVANAWHDGQHTALYSFTSTGAIRATEPYMGSLLYGTADEVAQCLSIALDHPSTYREDDPDALRGLAAYVDHYGDRGAQPLWSHLRW